MGEGGEGRVVEEGSGGRGDGGREWRKGGEEGLVKEGRKVEEGRSRKNGGGREMEEGSWRKGGEEGEV